MIILRNHDSDLKIISNTKTEISLKYRISCNDIKLNQATSNLLSLMMCI